MRSLRFFQQLDAMDCGAACLQSICDYYGRVVNLHHIRELCHISRNGVSMLGIADAAEALGFKTIGIKLNWDQLYSDVHLPCIIYWANRHFVVVKSVRKQFVTVMDPAVGMLKYPKEKFLSQWLNIKSNDTGESLGCTLLLSPSPSFYDQETERKKSVNLKDSVKFISPFRSRIWKIFSCMLIGCLVSLTFPYLTQLIVDIAIPKADIGFILIILIAELALLSGQIVNNVIRSRLMLAVSSDVSIGLISSFLDRLMKLPISFFDSKHIGDILQRIRDFNRIESFLTSTFLSMLLAGILFVVYGGMMLSYSLKIFGVFVVGSVLYVVWVTLFMEKRRRLDYMQFQYLSSNQTSLIQLVNGMQDIKLNSCERSKRWEWERLQSQIVRLRKHSLNIANIQTAGSSMIDQSKNLIITFLAAGGVIDGVVSIGEMVAIQYILGQLNAPLQQFISFLQSSQEAKISMERMREVTEIQEEEKLFGHREVTDLGDCTIRFSDVSFQYDGPRSVKVLDNINLEFENKKVTAVVGMSGCGKTTLLKLLLSFFTPTEGDVYIGNTSLKNISPKVWRSHCGVVMQDGFIFSDTIEKNIGLSDEEIDFQRVIEAAKKANIHDYIMSLPMKYNTKIGAEGRGLSSGQKQRLLIARAIYKNPPFIILDEATNSLDATNELDIMKSLETFFKDKTVIIVAHRLSTVRNADKIVVLSGGKVVEKGTHEELLERHGEYEKLINNQLSFVN